MKTKANKITFKKGRRGVTTFKVNGTACGTIIRICPGQWHINTDNKFRTGNTGPHREFPVDEPQARVMVQRYFRNLEITEKFVDRESGLIWHTNAEGVYYHESLEHGYMSSKEAWDSLEPVS